MVLTLEVVSGTCPYRRYVELYQVVSWEGKENRRFHRTYDYMNRWSNVADVYVR